MDLSKYRAMLFDLFHTLTSANVVNIPGRGTSEILGVGREDWNKQLLSYSDDRLRGRIKDPFVIIERMAHAIDPTIPAEIINEAVQNRIARFRYALTCIEGSTLHTLSELSSSGKSLGLVSNADVNEIAGWGESPLKAYFSCAVFSCEVGYVKPEREIYEIALKELGIEPMDALYVGDGGSDELQGAKNVGMTTVLTTEVIGQLWPERIDKARRFADYTIVKIVQLIG